MGWIPICASSAGITLNSDESEGSHGSLLARVVQNKTSYNYDYTMNARHAVCFQLLGK